MFDRDCIRDRLWNHPRAVAWTLALLVLLAQTTLAAAGDGSCSGSGPCPP